MKLSFLYTLIFFIMIIPFKELAGPARAENVPTGNLVILINNFRSDKGIARIHLYSSKEDQYYPTQPSHALLKITGEIHNNSGCFVFKNLPYGYYALTVHHDENGNGLMDRNFLGFPKEGYGFSNSLHPIFGPPHFKEAMFVHNKENDTIQVMMNYL